MRNKVTARFDPYTLALIIHNGRGAKCTLVVFIWLKNYRIWQCYEKRDCASIGEAREHCLELSPGMTILELQAW